MGILSKSSKLHFFFGLSLILSMLLLYGAQLLNTGWQLDLGMAGHSRGLAGFYPAERDNQGSLFRWSAPEAELWLHASQGRDSILTLDMFGYQESGQAQRILQIQRGSHAPNAFSLRPGRRSYHMLLPPLDPLSPNEALKLRIDALQGQSSDSTSRGIVLYAGKISAIGWPAPWRAIQLGWLCGLLGLLVIVAGQALFLNAKRRPAPSLMPIAMLVCLLAACGLAIGLWQRPELLGWALPFTPWALGLLSVLLALPLLARAPAHRWAGIALLVIAQICLYGQISVALGLLSALAGMALLSKEAYRPDTPSSESANISTNIAALILAGILLLALGLRFYRIESLPFGLWRDEGRHGLAALRMLAEPNYWPAYIPSGVDLPGLGLRPFSWALAWWGIHPWTMRIMTALAGALTIIPLYGLTATLFGRKQGLLAAMLLACASWSLTLSRFSFPTIFDPLLQLSALWLLAASEWRNNNQGSEPGQRQTMIANSDHPRSAIANPRSLISWIVAGICLGLAAQTYHTGRLGILTAALLVALAHTGWWRKLACLTTVTLALVITAWPLISYAISNAEDFNARVGLVFLLSERSLAGQAPLAALDDSLGRHILMLNSHGDDNGRHHAPGSPMLDALTGLAMLIGLSRLPHLGRRGLLIALGLLIGAAPSLLAVDSPHAMRSIHVLGWACMLAAIGLYQLWTWLIELRPAQRLDRLRPALMVGILSGVFCLNAWLYFVDMPRTIAVWGSFYPFHTQIGTYIRDMANREGPEATQRYYVPQSLAENPVFGYLTYGLQVRNYTNNGSSKIAPNAQFFVTGAAQEADIRMLIEHYHLNPHPTFIGPPLPDQHTPSFIVYSR